MHKIESQDEFAQWARYVNHADTACSPHKLCDLQDEFAWSDGKALKRLFIESDQTEKELLVFSIQKAMGSGTLLEFIKSYSVYRAQVVTEQEQDDINSKWTEVLQKERDITDKLDKFKLTLAVLESQNKALVTDNDNMTAEVSRYYQHNMELQDTIKDMQETVDKLSAFESHIKELLTV